MNQDNRRKRAQLLFDRWARGFNERDLAALSTLAHTSLVLRPLTTLRLPSDPYRGHRGLAEWIAESSHRFAAVSISGSVAEAGEDRLLVEGTITVCKRSRTKSETAVSWLLVLDGGLVAHDETFLDPVRARDAFGAGTRHV